MLIKTYFHLDFNDETSPKKYIDYVRTILESGAESCGTDVRVRAIKIIDETIEDDLVCPRCNQREVNNLKKWHEGEVQLGIYSCQHCDHAWIAERWL